MSLVKAKRVQLNSSATATQNFVLDASDSNGTMKLARGNSGATTQDIITVDASGNVTIPQNLTVTGTLVGGYNMLTTAAVPTTSGTSITLTGVPSWARRVTLLFKNIKTSNTNDYMIQLGASTIETTGYTGSCLNGTSSTSLNSTGFIVCGATSTTSTFSGSLLLTLGDSNTWFGMGLGRATGGAYYSGTKVLSGVLQSIKLLNASTDTFNSGTIQAIYEG